MIHVVVHSYYPWFKFYVPLFQFRHTLTTLITISKSTGKQFFFPRIKLNHNIHNLLFTKKTKHETSS